MRFLVGLFFFFCYQHSCSCSTATATATSSTTTRAGQHLDSKHNKDDHVDDVDWYLATGISTAADVTSINNDIRSIWMEEGQQQQLQQEQERDLQTVVEATFTLYIQLDGDPGETYWDIKDSSNNKVVAFVADGTYKSVEPYSRIETQITLTEGKTYKFTLYDSYGDGLDSFYYLYYGDKLRSDRSNIVFFQDMIMGATPLPAGTVTQLTTSFKAVLPTVPVSSCTESELGFGIVHQDPFDPTPLFGNPSTTFDTNTRCTRHTDYTSCTNESGEDCQWVFGLSSTGICRIDPVTKCLKMGDCVCHTEDFHGGRADYADGIVFHVPISITARDISEYTNLVTYKETFVKPTVQNPLHPIDETFFISKVDFTARQLKYTFKTTSPVLKTTTRSICFKLHYLYRDTSMIGRIWEGTGLVMDIDTAKKTLVVNGHTYTLPVLKKWTCTQFIVTAGNIYIAGVGRPRELSLERVPAATSTLTLGKFSGEVFDVRIYDGTLSLEERREVGARCTGPNDPASLLATRDIDVLYARKGCKAGHEIYFPNPTSGGHTYGSHAFGTMWIHPRQDPDDPNIWYDIPEGQFDEEEYFQHHKLQSYLWERFYFDADMIAINLKPYRYIESEDQIPEFARTMYNNPCRYMHQNNNQWEYPFYDVGALEKWTPEDPSSPNDVFDLASIARDSQIFGYTFVAHETFHEFHGTLSLTYGSGDTLWLMESTASFASAMTFPRILDNKYAGFTMAPAYPLAYWYGDRGVAVPTPHFQNSFLGIHEDVRGSHIYSSWVVWWFLSEFAGMPHILGTMHSQMAVTNGRWNGIIGSLRLFVEAENKDFGDVFSVFIAHHRTWDLGRNRDAMEVAEQLDFEYLRDVAKLSSTVTLESLRTTVNLNPNTGTSGNFVAGPLLQRPGPFGRNCLTARNVLANRVVGITIKWDDGMGFPSQTAPTTMKSQQVGCDSDMRFYSNIVVMHNEVTDVRRYWKLKGKTPATLYVATGNNGPVTIHILLIPTPPTDYVEAKEISDTGPDIQTTIPIYSYQYSVQILGSLPSGATLKPEASKSSNGIVQFEPATAGWWPIRCSCSFPVSSGHCVSPTFERVVKKPAPQFCFSGETTVDVKGRGLIAMASLKVGDEVLVASGQYETVYSFGHRHETMEAYYLRFEPSNLEISVDHMVKMAGSYKPASSVRVGDILEMGTGEMMVIKAIDTVIRSGAYAPFTKSGTIVVNNIKASSYISFHGDDHLMIGNWRTPLSFQWVAHLSQCPHRLWIRMVGIGDEVYTDEGLSTWISMSHQFALWYLDQSSIVMILLLVPALAVLVIASAVEAIFGWWM